MLLNMARKAPFRGTARLRTVLMMMTLSVWVASAQAQNASPDAPREGMTLRAVFERSWLRQPEAQTLQARRDAMQARARAADLTFPEPFSLEINQTSGSLVGGSGTRETELGLAVPLWLPGQRTASRALAHAEGAHLERKWLASQLRLAALVREAWWTWLGANADASLANDQWTSARRLAADVARRTQAGDLARADQHQAEGAVAAAEAFAAQAQATASSALAALVALTGDFTLMHAGNAALHQATLIHQATLSEPTPVAAPIEDHPLLVELKDRLAIAEATIQLVKTQTRANPELKFSAGQSRESSAEGAGQTKVLIGIRLPLQAGPRHDARLAAALAEALEVQSQWRLERDRILADQHAAQARMQSAQAQVEAARRRARLAKASLAFFDKSFRLGETGLPQRLRIEAEAAEAQRQEARSQIVLAAALSAWRQALGLLPQ